MERGVSKILSLVAIGVVFIACKKDPLPELPEQNNPYYTVKGNLDGEEIDYAVGDDGVTIVYGTDEMNGVETYYGKLTSPGDNLVMKIEVIRPEHLRGKEGLDPLREENLDFLVHNPGCISFNFGTAYNQYNNFQIMNEDHEFIVAEEIEFDEYGIYPIYMKFTDITSTSEIYETRLKYGFENADAQGGFQAYGIGDSVFIYPYHEDNIHQWYIDGQLISTDDHFEGQLSNGVHSICHISTDMNGNDNEVKSLLRIKDGELYWQLGHNYCAIPPSENQYGKVIISLTKDGVMYSSEHASENLENTFKMQNVNYVKDNSLNFGWAIYDFAFDSATLYDESKTEHITLSDISGTFNIGLK